MTNRISFFVWSLQSFDHKMYNRHNLRKLFEKYERRYIWWCVSGLIVHLAITVMGHPVIGTFFLCFPISFACFNFGQTCLRMGITKYFFSKLIFRDGDPILFWFAIAQAWAFGIILAATPFVLFLSDLGLFE